MRADSLVIPDPRSLPDNANLPLVNQPATILGITISFLSLAVFAISLRLWVRIRNGLWGLDDAFVLLAGIASIIGDTMVCLMPGDGMGLHLWTLDNQHLTAYFRHIYTTNTAYCASATFIKLSIMFQYLRLFREKASSTTMAQYRLARQIIWSLILIISLWGVALFLLALFPCNPIAKNWKPYLPGRCVGWGTKDPNKFFAMFLGHAVSNMVLDIMVLVLPIPFLGMLGLAGKGKASLFTLFTLGCIVGALAIGRMIALSVNRAGTVPVIDMSYHTPSIYILGVLEVNVAIIAASIPIFWPAMVTLAANKIFVVNEVEIHVEDASKSGFGFGRGIGLAEQGNVSTKPNHRPLSRSHHQTHHKHKHSNTSSLGRNLALDLGHRSSQDSNRCLHRTPSSTQDGGSSKASLPGNSDGDGDGDCDNPGHQELGHGYYYSYYHEHDHDRDDPTYDYFLEVDKEMAGGRTTTTIARADVPIHHIRALDAFDKTSRKPG